MSKILIIAEKSSVCKRIKDALEKGAKYNKGYYEGEKFIFTHCVGHLLTLQMPENIDEKYKKWSFETLPLNFNYIPLEVNKTTKDQFKVVEKLMKRNDVVEIVNLCDSDREGELIFRNLMHYVKPNCTKITRMWLTTTESDEALVKCFKERLEQKNYDKLFKAAVGRSYADYLIGLTSTRAVTLKFGGFKKTLTIGRVQTPTLKIIVDRELEIKNFKSKNFYKVVAHTKEKIDGNYKNEDLEDNRFVDIEDAKKLIEKVGVGNAKITKYDEKIVKTNAPLLYNLSDLQIEMNSKYKMTADDVLNACQSLYETYGLTTYPRTSENRISPEVWENSYDYVKALPDTWFKEYKEEIFKNSYKIQSRAVAKKDIGSHEALMPTRKVLTKATKDALTENELNCYKAICIRFLENFFPPAEYKEISIAFEKEKETFTNNKKYLINKGYLSVNSDKDIEIPKGLKLNVGDNIFINDFEIVEGKTEAPKRFTEGTLLRVMKNPVKYVTEKREKEMLKETDGIGTEATRSNIIETLKKQKYIKTNKGSIVPTVEAMELMEKLGDRILTSVSLTAICERYLTDIANGTGEYKAFMKFINELNINFVEDLKCVEKTSIKGEKEVLCKCPVCDGDIISGQYGYYCENKCGVSVNADGLKYLKGPKITKTLAKELLTKGKSKRKYEFISSKTNDSFEAYVCYEYLEDEKYKNKLSLSFR